MDFADYIRILETKLFTGEDIAGNWIFLILMNACAVAYAWFGLRMRAQGVLRRVFVTHILLFLTAEAWLLAFLLDDTVFQLWLHQYALIVAPLILLICGATLAVAPKESNFHWAALFASFGYSMIAIFFVVMLMLNTRHG